MVAPPQCDCTVHAPHALGRYPCLLIASSGLYRRFCDGDCIVQQLTADRQRAASEEVGHVA
jgi:hypothetical protein